ncbi:MAG: hypothetical protein LUC98_04290 [Lachnospiraceae bacterium]|nr:hypothetical protein [Lachnospiraceae bacterium]
MATIKMGSAAHGRIKSSFCGFDFAPVVLLTLSTTKTTESSILENPVKISRQSVKSEKQRFSVFLYG